MINAIRTNSGNKDFLKLVKLLDADLALRDGEDHSFYSQFNKAEGINHVVLIYQDGVALGCGGMKITDPKTVEIKRMYTIPTSRGKGLAIKVLSVLEAWAMEFSC